jgi:hypothetical protein
MEWHACMIYYIIVSHYNGFIETETAQIVLKDHGRTRHFPLQFWIYTQHYSQIATIRRDADYFLMR